MKAKAAIIRRPNSVFVDVVAPTKLQQVMAAQAQPRVWAKVVKEIGNETPVPKPSAEQLMAEYLPNHIRASRWGRYIVLGSQCRVFDSTTFVHHEPLEVFWNLYRLSKGIFKQLGISVAKQNGAWEVRFPISVLNDKVFVASGLAGVEKTLRVKKNPKAIADSIRQRQMQQTQRGIAAVKEMRRGLKNEI